jgi:translation initiation factor 3 subunit L
MADKSIPDQVKTFLTQFHQTIKDQQVTQINQNYDNGWSKITEKYYKQSEWPTVAQVSPLVGDGASAASANFFRLLVLKDLGPFST